MSLLRRECVKFHAVAELLQGTGVFVDFLENLELNLCNMGRRGHEDHATMPPPFSTHCKLLT